VYTRAYTTGAHRCIVQVRARARAHARCCTAIASSWNGGITFRHNRASALASAPRARQSPLLALFLLHLTIARILAAINVTAVKLTRNLRKRQAWKPARPAGIGSPCSWRDAHRQHVVDEPFPRVPRIGALSRGTRLRDYAITRLRDYAITRLRDYAILNPTSINERNVRIITLFPLVENRRESLPFIRTFRRILPGVKVALASGKRHEHRDCTLMAEAR